MRTVLPEIHAFFSGMAQPSPQPKRSLIDVLDTVIFGGLKRLWTARTVRTRMIAIVVLVLAAVAAASVAPEQWNAIRGPLPAIPGRPFRLGLDLQGGSHLVYEADMSRVSPSERREALSGVRDVIERRVNAFGVSEPLVQTAVVGEAHRLIVDLAGIQDVNQAIDQIGKTPILEFKEENDAPIRALTAEEQQRLKDDDARAKKEAEDVLKEVLAPGADFAALANKYTDDPGNMAITESGGTTPQPQGGDLGFVSEGMLVPEFEKAGAALPVGGVTQQLVATEFGYHIIKKLEEREAPAPEIETVGGGTLTSSSTMKEWRLAHILMKKLRASDIAPNEPWKNSELSGKQLERAQVSFDQQTGSVQIALQFNSEGAKLFADITKRNVGKRVAIFLDGRLLSDPVVQTEISNGQAVITGNYTIPQARQFARDLNAGALPVPISLVSQQTVGPSLGAASLERSLLAGLIGFAVVAVFMILFYRFAGVIAVVALSIYAVIVLLIFKTIPVTLTLAGIAGFILSIGMAVDANILIFERLKEELRSGKSLRESVDEGFRRAWLSIRDSNASSLITCLILSWLGTSLVKGFAITLAIGILVSMFSAIVITRTFLKALGGNWMEKHIWLFGVRRRSS